MRRELAIEVRDPHVTERLDKVVHRDWENSRRIDLSDAGLMAELQDTDANVAEDLALNPADN
jgi:cardiolipin synthase A/B